MYDQPNCDYDEYGEVINGELTYEWVADELKMNGKAFIGWTDQNGTHFDILFTHWVNLAGNNIQGGIKPHSDLFVSIMRVGAFGFENFDSETHPGYFEEKLATGRSLGSTAQPLADLINGVKKRLV